MKFKALLWLPVLALAALPVLGQGGDTHNVQFDHIRLSFEASLGSSVTIQQVPGDPVADAGPGFSDAAKTQFTFYDFGEPVDSIFDTGGVRVYRMEDVVQYGFLQEQVEQVEDLLDTRIDLAQQETLPFVPVLPHGQSLIARPQYVETGTVQGIGYITSVMAAQEPFSSSSFLYTFQGISNDGQYYVTAIVPLRTDLFPAEAIIADPAQFQQQWPDYLAESIATLNNAAPADFAPSLDAINALVQSVQLAA
ncbi:MAG: hypothetical protein CL610_30175 [Anaerolineaceae bacterium]|nr:hypothetical protein [Anaerolineaceae bacterium]